MCGLAGRRYLVRGDQRTSVHLQQRRPAEPGQTGRIVNYAVNTPMKSIADRYMRVLPADKAGIGTLHGILEVVRRGV